jgi:hypothetical protein
MPRTGYPPPSTFAIQVRCEQTRCGEMKVPTLQRTPKLWELPRSSRHRDPLVRDPFCEVQHVDAIVEHRRARLFEVEPSRIDLSEMADPLGFQYSIASIQIMQLI